MSVLQFICICMDESEYSPVSISADLQDYRNLKRIISPESAH